MRRFFIDRAHINGEKALLTGSDARHARLVLRLKNGDRVLLFDGQGRQYYAEIVDLRDDSIEVRIEDCCDEQVEMAVRITIAQAFLKEKKMDALVRQVTELGICRWVPFIAERSVSQPDPQRMRARMERWRKIGREAMKQCRRVHELEICPPPFFDDILVLARAADLSFLFWEGAAVPIHGAMLSARRRRPKDVLAIIGPEGGFSDQEAECARNAGIRLVSLGGRILRAETATIAACTLLQYLYGDMG